MPNIRERAIASGLLLAIGGSIGFMIAFGKEASTQWEGLWLALTFVGFLIAALGWARWILPYEQVIEERDVGVEHHDTLRPPAFEGDKGTHHTPEAALEDRFEEVELAEKGVGELTRRKWLTRLLVGALAAFGLAALFPIGALGPEPDDTLFHTKWRRGSRMQRIDGTFVKVSDVNTDSIETVFPEGATGDAPSVAILLRLPNGVGRDTLDGFIAYSKVCTHAGCPVALYRASDHKLVCPCHQSVFDAAADAAVLDGPADHSLPRLPLEIGDDGYLRATGDFPEPVGPGFWEHS